MSYGFPLDFSLSISLLASCGRPLWYVAVELLCQLIGCWTAADCVSIFLLEKRICRSAVALLYDFKASGS